MHPPISMIWSISTGINMNTKWAATILAMVALVILLYRMKGHIVDIANGQPRLYHRPTDSTYRLNSEFSLSRFLPRSKELLVHSAHFDERTYRKGHSNITLFFLSARKMIFYSNMITGCGVGSQMADEFLVRPTQQQIHRRNVTNLTFPYEQYVLECYDLKVVDGIQGYVTYKTTYGTEELIVKSEYPIMIPAPRVQPTGKYNFTVATCTKAFNKHVAYLPEFVRYQKTIGVDHVHLSVVDEFIIDGSLRDIVMQDTFLREAIFSGFLSYSVMKVWYTERETFLSSSVFQRLGCYYCLRGTYDYISIADPDDFFNPRIPGERGVKYYIKEYCINKEPNAGSCRFRWRWLYPDVCGVTGPTGPDGNVTKTINIPKREGYHNSKSIHSSKAVIDFSFHDSRAEGCMVPGYKVVQMPQNVVYFAHNRLGTNKGNFVC